MTPSDPHRASSTSPRCAQVIRQLTELVYELLDAHRETSQIASEWNLDDPWQVHLSYLRDLQRVARELLATTGHPPAAA